MILIAQKSLSVLFTKREQGFRLKKNNVPIKVVINVVKKMGTMRVTLRSSFTQISGLVVDTLIKSFKQYEKVSLAIKIRRIFAIILFIKDDCPIRICSFE